MGCVAVVWPLLRTGGGSFYGNISPTAEGAGDPLSVTWVALGLGSKAPRTVALLSLAQVSVPEPGLRMWGACPCAGPIA